MGGLEIVGAIFIICGWALFLCFLMKSPDNGWGFFFTLNFPSWVIFAVAVWTVREHGIKAIPVAAFALLLSVPMLLAPLLIVFVLIPIGTDFLGYAIFGFVAMTLVTTIIFSTIFFSSQRSNFRWPFYCWPISNLMTTFGLFLLK